MKISDFQKELKEIDSRLEIVPNPDRPGLANIKLDGRDICPVPAEEIREESDHTYTYTFPNGAMARHKSRSEALAQVHNTLRLIGTPEGADLFFDR